MKYEQPIIEIIACEDVIVTSLTATTGTGEEVSLYDILNNF